MITLSEYRVSEIPVRSKAEYPFIIVKRDFDYRKVA